MKFEIADVVSKANIIVLFDGESYENLHDGFMIKSTEYHRSGYRTQTTRYHALCIRDHYKQIRYIRNAKGHLMAKRKNQTAPLVDVNQRHYSRRKKTC